MRIREASKGITRNVVVLGFVSLFTDISSEMLYPLVPIFLTSVLGAPMAVVGLIEGVAECTASLMKVFSGWVSDRMRKRRPFIATGYALSALSKPLLALAHAWPVVLVARFGDRFGKGLRASPRDALIADSCPPEFRGRAFGFHRAVDTIGAVLGPLIALLLIGIFREDYRLIFLISFIPASAAVLVIILFLRKEPTFVPSAGDGSGPGLFRFSGSFRKFLLVSGIFALGNSSDAFLILRAKDIGLATGTVILVYVAYNITYSLFSFPSGILADRIPKTTVMAAGYLVFALVYAGFACAATAGAIWALFLAYGFYIAMTDGVSRAFIAEVVPQEARATAIGMYATLMGIVSFFASLAGGFLWNVFGPRATFLYGAATAALACCALMAMFRRRART